jgi:glycosyltransferase involved in cell wall biosynthesis
VQRAYGLSAHVVPNGVELEALHPRPPKVHSPIRLVFVGRFSLQKNLLFLLEVLGKLRDLNWRLDLVGDGPMRAKLEDLSRRLDVAARIHFHGWVTPEAATGVMRNSDILVMPSLSEGLPLVGVQALGLGLALATSDHQSMKDLVQDGVNGFTCPATEVEAFARRLRDLLDNPPLLLAMKRASLKIAPRFEAGRVARQMEKLLLAAATSVS